MKPFLTALALSAAALAPAPALAAAPAAVPAADTEVQRLVALLAPDDAITRLAGKAFDTGMDQRIAADPERKAAYAADPAMRQAVGGQLRTRFTSVMVAALPSLRTEIETILRTMLTPVEVTDALAFFGSPTGQKVRAEAYEMMGSAPGQSPQEMQQAAIASVMAKMTAEDYPALMAFAGSTASQKMGTVNPRISAVSQAWADRLIAANLPKLKALEDKLAADYRARKGGK
ncbi:DUF2059 domain-containing protein [Sphingomonas sp. VL_57B]|jgi:hypothetical protein|nr:DUF2059 domain-containing protein [Pseudomonadota bacterium]